MRSSLKRSVKVVIITYAVLAILSGLAMAFAGWSMGAMNRLLLWLHILAGPFGALAVLCLHRGTPVHQAIEHLLQWFVVCGALIIPSFIWRYAILRVIAFVGTVLWFVAGWITLGAYG